MSEIRLEVISPIVAFCRFLKIQGQECHLCTVGHILESSRVFWLLPRMCVNARLSFYS